MKHHRAVIYSAASANTSPASAAQTPPALATRASVNNLIKVIDLQELRILAVKYNAALFPF